jgi:oligopeptidase B
MICVFIAIARLLSAGGGEMGREWYEDLGKYLTKLNTFHDFIDCGQFLVDQQITEPDKLAIVGRSAGGLLIGAVCNMKPSLFKAAVADVPFVDALNTMSDPTIPLTVTEWEEWGKFPALISSLTVVRFPARFLP